MIRKAEKRDVGRIAEILVFNNRINYYPIFKDIVYSFQTYNVCTLADQLQESAFLSHSFVYDSQVIKGFCLCKDKELVKLYVDPFFQNEGIGTKLLTFAVQSEGVQHLWVLKKNEKARRFYARHGFTPDGQSKFEEGTKELLVHLTKEGRSD